MSDILLSDTAYSILKQFSLSPSIPLEKIQEFPESCIDQLLSFKLIECHITDYDTSSEWIIPKLSDYSITELGHGYLSGRKSTEENDASLNALVSSAISQAESAKNIAEASLLQAESSKKAAKKSNIGSLVALLFSGMMVAIEIISNWSEILSFFKSIF